MSGKKSLLVDKSKMPLAMGIAFVAFYDTVRRWILLPEHRSISILSTTESGVC